jgi:hypothetical protein
MGKYPLHAVGTVIGAQLSIERKRPDHASDGLDEDRKTQLQLVVLSGGTQEELGMEEEKEKKSE